MLRDCLSTLFDMPSGLLLDAEQLQRASSTMHSVQYGGKDDPTSWRASIQTLTSLAAKKLGRFDCEHY